MKTITIFKVLFITALSLTHSVSAQNLPTDQKGSAFTQSFAFNVNYSDFPVEQEDKIQEALEAIVDVVESEAFKTAVLNFRNHRGENQFVENRNLSNAQIYELLLEGSERLMPNANRAMDLQLQYYFRNNSTVGYTYRNTLTIWLNGKFYRRYTVAQMARNLFHEWTHKLGFDHNSRSTAKQFTVPYGLGKIIENLVAQRSL